MHQREAQAIHVAFIKFIGEFSLNRLSAKREWILVGSPLRSMATSTHASIVVACLNGVMKLSQNCRKWPDRESQGASAQNELVDSGTEASSGSTNPLVLLSRLLETGDRQTNAETVSYPRWKGIRAIKTATPLP